MADSRTDCGGTDWGRSAALVIARQHAHREDFKLLLFASLLYGFASGEARPAHSHSAQAIEDCRRCEVRLPHLAQPRVYVKLLQDSAST